MAAAILGGSDPEGFCAEVARGPLSARAALWVHRNTVLGALANALSHSYPTVLSLLGRAFFDQAAALFGREHPPRTACLSAYGEGFPDFLAAYPPAAPLPYLYDVARFDWLIERAVTRFVHSSSPAPTAVDLDGTVTLTLTPALRLLSCRYPVDDIRAANGDDAALGGIDMTPRRYHICVWSQTGGPAAGGPAAADGGWHGKRQPRQTVATKRLREASAVFVAALLEGATADEAMERCMRDADTGNGSEDRDSRAVRIMAGIDADVFRSSYARLSVSEEPG